MAVGGKGTLERALRVLRTAFFMLTMLASLLVQSAPVLVALGYVVVSLALASKFACLTCYGIRGHLEEYRFRCSLVDIPLVSIARSFIITCAYALCDWPGLSHGPYLGTVTFSSIASILILCVKVCLFTSIPHFEPEDLPEKVRLKLRLKRSWGMPVLFLSSLVFALGHVVVAYRASCRAQRKLLLHRVDPESVLYCKTVFLGFQKLPRSPLPCSAKTSKRVSKVKGRSMPNDECDLPISLLADADSFFIVVHGVTVHYKLCLPASAHSLSSISLPLHELSPSCSPSSISLGRLKIQSKHNVYSSFSSNFHKSSLHVPLLMESPIPMPVLDEVPVLKFDDGKEVNCLNGSFCLTMDSEDVNRFAVVLVHGFGGGVFSWRHVMLDLARQIGCTVVAFDRPGWGLTPRLGGRVDLLISFCLNLGFSSVVLVGHDDGGLLALKAAEKIGTSIDTYNLDVKGVVLISVSLSREIVPVFARILLHASLGKKGMVRPLLRTEISQVINRHAWYNPVKLTSDVLNLYKVPLCVEGWDEALHEIGRLSFSTVLSTQSAVELLKAVENLPVLAVTGAENALVPLKSVQTMASKLVNSRLVIISGCGHLPHEECPRALLAALAHFITRLIA
ncbi:hypothetical protein HPP92_022892 [Vanilla planifolia]|uniref:AB hydrolase-1 domain-containing protein n=1 Tax=Vanilla planifolia TaxID=51239 RepID=A0A835PYA4_VANPL|nr:hypothetical protein HPP92_022892 [Vanilla planifolia]